MNSNARSTDIALQKSSFTGSSVATIKICDQLITIKSKEKKDIPFKEMLVASIDSHTGASRTRPKPAEEGSN